MCKIDSVGLVWGGADNRTGDSLLKPATPTHAHTHTDTQTHTHTQPASSPSPADNKNLMRFEYCQLQVLLFFLRSRRNYASD